MDTHAGRQRPSHELLIMAVLLVLALLVYQYWIARLFPWFSGPLGVDPALVFLDIPLHLPFTTDLLPVLGLFSLFYMVVILSQPVPPGGSHGGEIWKRLTAFFAGLFMWGCCMIAGGLIFHFTEGVMTKQIRNGMDSFGLNMDIYTPIPGLEAIHMRGSMLLMVCCVIGIRLFIRRVRKATIVQVQDSLQSPVSIAGADITSYMADLSPVPVTVDYQPRRTPLPSPIPQLAMAAERPGLATTAEQPGLAMTAERPQSATTIERSKSVTMEDVGRPKPAATAERPQSAATAERPGLATAVERPQLAKTGERPGKVHIQMPVGAERLFHPSIEKVMPVPGLCREVPVYTVEPVQIPVG